MIQAKQQLSKMRKRILSTDKEVYDVEARGREVYNHIFQGKSEKFFFEILQNSCDAYKRKGNHGHVSFKLIDMDEKLVLEIRNTGDEFNEEDVDSICNTLKTSKTITERKQYTGEFGIGFKKIFFISDLVEVHSGKYHFEFDKAKVERIKNQIKKFQEIDKVAWPLYPITLDDCYNNGCQLVEDEVTLFRIHVEKERFKQSHPSTSFYENPILWYKSEIEILTDRTLLFIDEITEVNFNYVETNGSSIQLRKLERSRDDEVFGKSLNLDYSNITGIKVMDTKDKRISEEYFIVFKKWISIEGDDEISTEMLKNDLLTQYYYRDEVKETEVGIALRLYKRDEHYELVPNQNGTLHQSLYSYEIFKELELHLPFFVLSDVITDVTRDVIKDSIWNKYVFNLIPDLFFEFCVPLFENHPIWKFTWAHCVYPNIFNSALNEAFQTIKNRIDDYPYLVSIDGSPTKLQNAIIFETGAKELHEYFEEIQEHRNTVTDLIGGNLIWIDSRCKIPNNPNLKPVSKYDININSKTSTISQDLKELIKLLAKSDKEHHHILLNNILAIIFKKQMLRRANYSYKYKIWQMDYIPTIDGNLVSLTDELFYVNQNNTTLLNEARKKGKDILHPNVNSSIFNTSETDNTSISKSIITEVENERQLKQLSTVKDLYTGINWLDDIATGWNDLSSTEKMEKTKILLKSTNINELELISPRKFSFIEVKCRKTDENELMKSDWVNIKNTIYFPLPFSNINEKRLIQYMKIVGANYILDKLYYEKLIEEGINAYLVEKFLRQLGIKTGNSLNSMFGEVSDKITEVLAKEKYEQLGYKVRRPKDKTWDWEVSEGKVSFYLEVKYRSGSSKIEFSYNQSSLMDDNVKVIFYHELDFPDPKLYHGAEILEYAQKHHVLIIDLNTLNSIRIE